MTALGKQRADGPSDGSLTVVHGPNFPDPAAKTARTASITGSCPEPRSPTLSVAVTTSTSARRLSAGQEVRPLVQLANQAVVVEAVKAADDRSGDVVVRCYESLRGQGHDDAQIFSRSVGRR